MPHSVGLGASVHSADIICNFCVVLEALLPYSPKLAQLYKIQQYFAQGIVKFLSLFTENQGVKLLTCFVVLHLLQQEQKNVSRSLFKPNISMEIAC